MKKKQYKIISLIVAIILCCFFSTIAYSAVYSTMNITGIAYARVVKDVRITDFKINSSSDVTSSYEEFSVNTISSKFNLVDSSSFITFDVEVTNYGASDVGILQLIGDVPTGLSYEIINYNLKDKICDDNGKCNQMAVKTFQIKFTGTPGEYEITQELDFRTYHKVTYTGINNNNYPTKVIDGGNLNITFTENLKKVTILSDGTEIAQYDQISSGQTITIENVSSDIEIKKEKELVARLVSGEIDEVGSEVCIKDECFYIISNDGSTVTMLAKYNLYVGGEYTGVWTAYGDEATGKQDSTMLGYVSGQSIRKGTTVFSNTNYWSSTVNSYPAYVYDSNSPLYSYVENYKTYLSTLGVIPTEARLITKEELEGLGCSGSSCSTAPSWVYATSYWSGSANSSHDVRGVDSGGYFNYDIYSYNIYNGCRPVIEMSIDDIKLPEKPVMVSGDYDTVGSEVAIGDEHFYVISSTDDTVTMLAKYNLHVGNSVDENGDVTPLSNPTGIQDKTARGYNFDDETGDEIFPFIGTTAFSEIDLTYSGSLVEGYVNNYNNYLLSQGVTTIEARIITDDELSEFGCYCDAHNFTCIDSPEWIHSISYWTYDYVVLKGGMLYVDDFDNSSASGVRPVITISKSNF